VLAYRAARLHDVVAHIAVEDEVHLGIDIAFGDVREHFGHGGAEAAEVGVAPFVVFVLADGRLGPAVVGAAEYQYHVGAAEIVHTGDERAVAVVLISIAGIADGGA